MYTGSFRLLASFFLLPLTHEPSGNNIALGKGVRVQNSPVVVPKRSFSIASVARKSRVKYLVYLTPSKLPNHLLRIQVLLSRSGDPCGSASFDHVIYGGDLLVGQFPFVDDIAIVEDHVIV
jgi:hypothetical protein